MIFDTQTVRLILAGKKTTCRRPVWPKELPQAKTHRYTAGSTVPLQRRPTRAELADDPHHRPLDIGTLTLTAVTRGVLSDTTIHDAIAEGHKTTRDFYAAWEQTWPVWAQRLDQPVWIITFTPNHDDLPVFMHRNSSRGYTTLPRDAMKGEPEVLDPSTLERYAKANNQRHAALKAGLDDQVLAEQRTLEDRLSTLRRMAGERGVDIRSDVRVIERRLDAIERQIRTRAA